MTTNTETKTFEVLETVGPCSMWAQPADEKCDTVRFVGPTGEHEIFRAGDEWHIWSKRVKAHWRGFLANNGQVVP